MKKAWVLGCVSWAAWSLAVACGDSEAGPGSNEVEKPPVAGAGGESEGGRGPSGGADAASGGADGTTDQPAASGGAGGAPDAGDGGRGGDSEAGGSGGAAEPGGSVLSRPAGIQLVIDNPDEARGLTFSSIHVRRDDRYVEWFGELFNAGDEVQCLAEVESIFQDGSGATVVDFRSYAAGPAYDVGTPKLPSPCVAPGESVPVWSNRFVDEEVVVDLDAIETLVATIDALPVPDAVLHPATPTLSELERTYSAEYEAWVISGTATATADINTVRLEFWGKDGDFFVGSDFAYHGEDFLAGETWEASTAPLGIAATSLTEVVGYFSFITGLGAEARVHFDARARELNERRNDAARSFEETRARYAELRRRLGR